MRKAKTEEGHTATAKISTALAAANVSTPCRPPAHPAPAHKRLEHSRMTSEPAFANSAPDLVRRAPLPGTSESSRAGCCRGDHGLLREPLDPVERPKGRNCSQYRSVPDPNFMSPRSAVFGSICWIGPKTKPQLRAIGKAPAPRARACLLGTCICLPCSVLADRLKGAKHK